MQAPTTFRDRYRQVHSSVRRGAREACLLCVDLTRRKSLDQSWGGPFNGQQQRRRAIEWLIDRFGITTAVETGTYRATTTAWFVQERGLKTFSVEANWRFYAYSRLRLRGEKCAHLRRADSRAFLREMAAGDRPPARALFYLDAHWKEDLPLREEVDIVQRAWPAALVVIDDFQVVDDPGYGFDDYGPGKVVGPAQLPPLAGFDCYLPAVPSGEETGARRGWALLGPRADRAVLTECPWLRAAPAVDR